MFEVRELIAIRNPMKRCGQIVFTLFFLSISLILTSLSPVHAQEAARSWMHEYVQLRVASRTVRAIEGASPRSSLEADRQAASMPRIIGGDDATDEENPFQVALLEKAISNDFRAQFCGGTLIGPNSIVTAAHCSDFISAGIVQVLVGTRRLDGSGERHDVSSIAIHPDWNPNTFDYDVAVWRLSTEVTGIPTATLATEDGPVGEDLLVTGWGDLAEQGANPIDLQAVEVPLVSRENCNDDNSYDGDILDSMLCAGLDEGGKDACQGDSGGPLTMGTSNSVLTGIVSWGIGCARPNKFGVYARVSHPAIREFIESNAGVPARQSLFQVHNTGAIWQFTGTPCSGDSCPGWQRLDNNSRTRSVAASGGSLFQLHNSGEVWRFTGTPCSGNSCPGWQRLDNNPRTVAIAASGGTAQPFHLYQLHNTGEIWQFTGVPCAGNSCPGWRRLDNNSRTVGLAASDGKLYQLHNNGSIWRFTGTPCSGNSCPGWQRLDNNSRTVSFAARGDDLFQLHNNGAIWRFTGTPCSGNSCPGWQRLDNNPRTRAVVASGDDLFQLHSDGAIWRFTGPACSGNSCPGWQRLDNNPRTLALVAVAEDLFQLHNSGAIWRFTGTPCSQDSCPGWERIDNNRRSREIAVAND